MVPVDEWPVLTMSKLAFGRGTPTAGVAPPSNMATMLGRRDLSAWRRALKSTSLMARTGQRRGGRAAGLSLFCVVAVLAMLLMVRQMGQAAPSPLGGTYDSVEALADEVLRAMEANDAEALQRVALTADEFRDHVWPSLPSAGPERNVPFDFVWSRLRRNSDAYLRQTLAQYASHDLTLAGVEFSGETSDYGPVRVHRETWLRVRDADGVESTVRFFGSTIEQDGRYKVFSYVVDD
jgi:hypothetical protein